MEKLKKLSALISNALRKLFSPIFSPIKRALRTLANYILLFGFKNIFIAITSAFLIGLSILPWAHVTTNGGNGFLYPFTWPTIWLYIISIFSIFLDYLVEIYIRKKIGFRALGLFDLISVEEVVKEQEIGNSIQFLKKLIYDNFSVNIIIMVLAVSIFVLFGKLRTGGYFWVNALAIIVILPFSLYSNWIKKNKKLAKKFVAIAAFLFYSSYLLYLYEIYNITGGALRTTQALLIASVILVILILII